MAARLLALLYLMVIMGSVNAQQPFRDPFATLSNQPEFPNTAALEVANSQSNDTLKLKAILWSDRPLANISGMIVAPGDRVHDFTVLQLSRKTAILQRADESIILVLEEDN